MATASAAAVVPQYLTAALSHRGPSALPYSDDARGTIYRHLVDLSHAFPTLRPAASHFTHNDGLSANLLRADGTIRLSSSSSAPATNLPVTIWLLEAYPRLPPAVFLSFPPGTALKPRHPLVDPSGVVSVPYLRSWVCPFYNLVDLVRNLAHLFSQDPPLVLIQSRSANAVDDAKTREINKILKAVQRDLTAAARRHAAEMEALLGRRTQLEKRREEVARLLRRAEEEKELLEQQLQMDCMNCDVVGSWVAENKNGTGKRWPAASVEDVFEMGCTAHSRQKLECTAADMAMEDVIYALDEALSEGCVSLSAYLKSVRALSREQFFHRAKAAKISSSSG